MFSAFQALFMLELELALHTASLPVPYTLDRAMGPLSTLQWLSPSEFIEISF